MTSSRTRRVSSVVAVAALAATGAAFTGGSTSAAPNGPTMNIQLLSFNDFHGNLKPPTGSSARLVTGHALNPAGTAAVDVTYEGAGGVEYLATHLKQARVGHPYSLTVAAGDIVGASPLLSASFHDEPTIEAMNSLGLDATSVGNHEFDEGYKELQRLANGGCIADGAGANNQDSCPGGKSFAGADFPILAANVKYAGTNQTILPPYTIKNIKGAKIGFIGMTLKDTPNIVTKSGIEGLEFTDEVQTANALVPELRAQGVNAIVVLIHQGGAPARESWVGPDGKTYNVNPNYKWACEGGTLDPAQSPILGIAANLDPAIDMVISGHTHQPYVCNVPDPKGQPRMVTSASSFGRLFTDTELTYDKRTQDIVRTSVDSANMIVTRTVPADPAQTALINRYNTLVAPIASRVLGTITADVTTAGNAGGESQLGDLIADGQLADPSTVTAGKTPVIAFMNPGGIRTNLTYANKSWNEQPGEVTYEEAFNVQPFNNYLVSMDLTGSQVKELLREQWGGGAITSPNTVATQKILQISKGFAYSYTDTPTGRVLGAVTLNGAPLVDTQSYRIVTNNFLSDGGDGFPAFVGGTTKYFGGLDIDAFANYLEANSPYSPTVATRITKN
ncbi:bifunctional metallophosphatase/5'-nucleotidase [Pedococcus bigeumensis]|uniref:Bifunctional metallophosphatase/5'-nucleotidase n=1 Tax=Pedococcus bigeumensis TaxID=433644 RepID=A0A502CNF9_9MICO|nr:bifunctional metallophosphatase/5'-nucleotidase [Pedococcus bigeumensis]TPG14100.1 bifunctional metallophosphatase/5'-nucleotidase [Pedococcus bigeumensis]